MKQQQSRFPGTPDPNCRAILTVLGSPTLTVSGSRILQGKRKSLALVSYLALTQQQSVTREHLAGLLWGGSPDRQARASLRQVLSEIRHAIGPSGSEFLAFEGDAVILDSVSFNVDIIEIAECLESGELPDVLLTNPNISDNILHSFDDLCEDYTSWLLEFRSRFRERISRGLRGKYASDTLSREARRSMAEFATLFDPLNEEAYRVSMALAAEDGNVGNALQTYARLYEVLDEKLGMEPSALTQDLVVKIKTGHFDGVQTEAEVRNGPAVAAVNGGGLATGKAAGIPIVAVFPFRSLGPDTVPVFFSRGIVEDTVCMLATMREPRVISSNSTRDLTVDAERRDEVLKTLGADYFLSGTIRKAGDNHHLSVQLTDTRSGFVEWAQMYDCLEEDLFDVQTNLAQNIAQKLIPSLRFAELKHAKRSHPRDLSAYHLMLVARDLAFRLERMSFEKAGELLKLAAEKDPDFSATFLAMADWFSVRLGQGWSESPREDQAQLEKMANTAFRLNADNGRALAMLGHSQTIRQRKYQEAQVLFERAIECSPNDAETLMWSSPTLSFIGQTDEAIKRAEEAIALSPSDPFLFRYEHFLSIAHYAAGDYSASAYWGLSSYQRNPHYTSNLRMTAASMAAIGNMKDSKEFAHEMTRHEPDFTVGSFLTHQPFRDQRVGQEYARHLLKAGLKE